MSVETPQPQQTPQPPKTFDTDRITDVLDARIDSAQAKIDQASATDATDTYATTEWDSIARVNDTIIRFPAADGITPSQYLEHLEGIAQKKKDELEASKGDSRDRRAAELRALTDTIIFVSSDMIDPRQNDDLLRSYRVKQQEATKTRLTDLKTADQNTSAQQADSVRTEAGLDKEQQKKELIDEVVKVCGANFFTSWPWSMDKDGHAGFNEKADSKFLSPRGFNGVTPRINFLTGAENYFSKYPEHKNRMIDQSLADRGITEVLYLEPVEEAVTESRTTYEDKKQGGVLGLGTKTIKVPKTEQVVTGKRSVPMSELVKSGGDAACYRLCYTTSSRDQDRRYNYNGHDKRPGQTLNAEILLPEKLAVKVVAMVREDPDFLHQLIDELAIRDIGIPEDMWREGAGDANGQPLRPPYEEWRATDSGRSRLYMVEKSQIQEQIDQGNVDFDPNFVIEY